jgi:SAM-dependent methyltransferase
MPEIMLTPEDIQAWYHTRRTPHMGEGDAQAVLALLHPKGVFFKTLPYDSCVLDVGAGDGSLHIFRTWPFPPRTDIRVYAYALEEGQYYNLLDGYELGCWPETKPAFPGVAFNAIFCSHFIEHIESPGDFISWCAARLPREGRIYLEWPSPCALGLPGRSQLEAAGVKLIISSYRDDDTHRELPAREAIMRACVREDFFIEQTGVVRLPYLEDELLAHFASTDRDLFGRQSAFWSKTYWAQFIVAVKA